MGKLIHRTAPACTYFVTTKSSEGRAVFQVAENAETLVECLLKYRDRGGYLLHELVVMPDHLHLLLTPGEKSSLEKATGLIKGGSSHDIHRRRNHKMEIWQPGFHDWTIRDEPDFLVRRNYIRMNPVEAHLANQPEEWLYGSASGKFAMDQTPNRFLASGAEAHAATPG